ncbi:hypothetical protein NicSoilC12_17810 [Arthrobacter sp. NicSoilC12]|nr:hypothetical protein NicSoilC12_17810 [Arthrobacter sp. NicSoilC12]
MATSSVAMMATDSRGIFAGAVGAVDAAGAAGAAGTFCAATAGAAPGAGSPEALEETSVDMGIPSGSLVWFRRASALLQVPTV